MKKMYYYLTNIILILLIALTPFIPNIFSLICLACFTITLFAIRKEAGWLVVISYIILLPTLMFKLSVTYDFVYKINVSLSYCLLTDGIAIFLLLFYLFYNLAKEGRKNKYVYR